jgi:hypothetical protein
MVLAVVADADGRILAMAAQARCRVGQSLRRKQLQQPVALPTAGRAARRPRGAVELLGLVRRGDVPGPVAAVEGAWDALTVHRAVAALATSTLDGPLAILVRHDAAEATSYVDTLAAWLAAPGRPRQAAERLQLHPNSLRHRMKRLVELAKLDLADPRQRLALQLQIEAVGRSSEPV